MNAAEREAWYQGVHRWTGGVHRRLRSRISVAGPLAAFGVATTAVTMFVSTFAGGDATSGAGTAPVVLPGICSNCAGTPSPAGTAPAPGRTGERASRSTAHTTRPTQTPTLTATQPPPALLAPAPDTSPSMTVCPPPLPPTKPSKSKKPKGKPSPSPTPIDLTTDSRTRGGTGRRDRT